MNSTFRINNTFGLTLGTLTLALLTACGGGGEEPAAANAPVQETAAPAAVTICGEQAKAVTGPNAFKTYPVQAVDIDGYLTQFSLLNSSTGYPYDGTPLLLTVPLEDLRDVVHVGYTPQDTQDSMGIEMGTRLKAGSVGCVRSVSRVKNEGTEANPSYLITWASETMSTVPVDAVPNHAINGFEFLNNFDNTVATAVFRMDKSLVTDETTVQICHIGSSGSPACQSPVITDDGSKWVFKAPITEAGVYVLSATPRELPMD